LIAKPASASHASISDDGDVEMADVDSNNVGVGASSRGLFLRIDSIYSKHRETSPSGKPTAMLSGMLYELVDEDWEEGKDAEASAEVSAPSRQAGPSSPKGSSNLSTAPVSQVPLFIPNPSLLSAAPPTSSSDSSDDNLNLKLDMNVPIQDKGKGKAVAPPVTRPSRRATFKPSSNDTSTPLATTFPLSGPSPAYVYRLPAPPPRYKFRPILPSTHEVTMSVVLLSGRYYPGILQSPLMQPFVEAATVTSESEPQRSMDHTHALLWALEGYVAGVYNAVDPSTWMSSRIGMVRAAADTAKGELLEYWKSREEHDPDVIIIDG